MRIDPRARTVDTRLKDNIDIFVGKGGRNRIEESVSVTDLTGGSVALITLTDFVPANVWLLGVYVEILADIAGTVVNLDIGDGTDVDRWGAGIGITEGTQTTTADFTAADAFGVFLLTAEDVVIRDDGVLLMTGGQFRVGVIFQTGSAEIRRR